MTALEDQSPGHEAGQPECGDEELIERLKRGDEEAAHALFDRYATTLRGRVERGLPTRLQAKISPSDVMQEAYVSAFLGLGHFDPQDEGAFRAWLVRILRNRLQDEIRRLNAKKRDARREAPFAQQPQSRDPSPSTVMMAAEQRAAVWRAIDKLPEDQQRVLRLVYEDDVPLADAAAELGRSSDATRKLCARAIRRLADVMGSGSTA